MAKRHEFVLGRGFSCETINNNNDNIMMFVNIYSKTKIIVLQMSTDGPADTIIIINIKHTIL